MKQIITKKRFKVLLAFFTLFSLMAEAQNEPAGSFLDLGADYFQVKDGKNYGLVFNGGKLNISYLRRWDPGNDQLNYRGDFGIGPSFSRGIAGINFKLNPLNLDYSFRISGKPSFRLFLGPYISMNYHFQLYPELQSGHALWFTVYDLGPRIILETRKWEQDFRLSFSGSVAGLVSRPVEMNEVYYYSLKIGDIIQKMHSNFQFGSTNIISHVEFDAEWRIPGSVKSHLAYRIEYIQYTPQASLDYISHMITYRLKLGTKRNP